MKNTKLLLLSALIITGQTSLHANIQEYTDSLMSIFWPTEEYSHENCEKLRQMFIKHISYQSGKELSDKQYKLFSDCGRKNKHHLRDNDKNDIKDLWNSSFIHQAANRGTKKDIACLAEAGVDLNSNENLHNKSPLHIASSSGNLKTAAALIEFGADINIKDNYGDTPLHKAQHPDMIKLLAENNANIEQLNNNNETPFYSQISSLPKPEIVQAHIDIKANLNTTRYGVNVIQNILSRIQPSHKNKKKSIQLIVKAGADLSTLSEKEKQQVDEIMSEKLD